MSGSSGTSSRSRGRRALCIDLLLLAAYVVLSLAMTYPLFLHLDSHLAGHYRHARVFHWNNWWVRQAVRHGLDPNYTDYLFYPGGVSLVSHNVNWASSLLSVPLQALLGQTVTYNLLFLLTFWLSGFAMYMLALHLTRRRDAAFLAGLVYAFFPYHVLGNWDAQLKLANVQWLPLFVLFLLRTFERGRVWDALLAGLFLALAGLDCWFYLIFLAMWGLLWLAYTLIAERGRWRWKNAGFLVLAAAVSLPLMAPFLAPVAAGSVGGSLDYALTYYADVKSSDLLAFLLPSSAHPLWGTAVAPLYERLQHWRPATLGYVALLLAAYAVLARPRCARLWLLSSLLFLGLAAGTTLTVNGVGYPQVPTPYGLLIQLLPALRIVRQASRFNVMVGLALAALAGIGWAEIADRLTRRGRAASGVRWGATVLASALILFEYLAVPCPLTPTQVNPFYRQLAGEKGDFAVLELPLDDYYARESMYPQTVHHKKLLRGHLARISPEAFDYIESDPILKSVYIQMAPDPATHDVAHELGVLAANGVRYAVIHKSAAPDHPALDEGVLASWRQLFGPGAAYEDDEVVAYRLSLAPSQGILQLGGELGIAEVRARRTWLLPPGSGEGQWLAVDLTWKALANLDRDYECRLSLLGADGAPVTHSEAELVSPRYPTSRWPAGMVIADQYALPLEPALPAGEYLLLVAVQDAASGDGSERATAPIRVEGEAQPFVTALVEMEHAADVNFGGEMQLLGYSAQQEGGRLRVALFWQALVAMQHKYKIFLHLLRAADGAPLGGAQGEIVAQHDAMPRDWSYPTSMWGRREVYVEQVALDVSGVETGLYHLAVGVYEPQSGRLPVVDRGGSRLPDDRAVLREAIELERSGEMRSR